MTHPAALLAGDQIHFGFQLLRIRSVANHVHLWANKLHELIRLLRAGDIQRSLYDVVTIVVLQQVGQNGGVAKVHNKLVAYRV